MSKLSWTLGMAVGALMAAGCATEHGAAPDVAPAQASVRAAEEMGAPSDPKAALHLQLAKDETQKAQELIKDGNEDRATTMLQRAEADGELALVLAKDAHARTEAQQAIDRVNQLKQQQAPQQATP